MLKNKYSRALLEQFPVDVTNSNDYLHDNTFTGADEDEYKIVHAVFFGKKWNEVDIQPLCENKVFFSFMTDEGMKYYLPALLDYFFDLEETNTQFYQHVIDFLCSRKNLKNTLFFTCFSPLQSKLIALFLVNAATLIDDPLAQKGLTIYWGNFLLC